MEEICNRGTICIQGGYSPKNGEPRVLRLCQGTNKYDEDLIIDLSQALSGGKEYAHHCG